VSDPAKGLDKIDRYWRGTRKTELAAGLRARCLRSRVVNTAFASQTEAIEAKLMAWPRANAASRRLAAIPGVGTDRAPRRW